MREELLQYARNQYGTEPEHLWASYPNYEVLRHASNNKWYGIIMDVERRKLDLPGEGRVDIAVVKARPEDVALLREADGCLPAYHMNKQHWVSVLLDGSVEAPCVFQLLDESWALTK